MSGQERRRRPNGTLLPRPLAVPDHAHPIVRRLYAEITMQNRSVYSVAKQAGLDRQNIRRWATESVPSVPNLEAALNAVGLKLAVVPISDDTP